MSAMLLVRGTDVPEGRRARLGAHVPSIASLFFAQGGDWPPLETRVRIRVAILTEAGSCEGEDLRTLGELATADTGSRHPLGPSLFGLMTDGTCGWEIENGYAQLS